MLTLLTAALISLIGISCMPFLRKSLHPLELLSCGIMIASLEQFSYAILTVNLRLIKSTGNSYEFVALKLEQIMIVPLLILFGLNVLFSDSIKPLAKAIVFAGTIFLLWGVQYVMDLSGIIRFVKWTWRFEWLRDAAILAVSIGFLALMRKFLRRQEVSRDPVSSDPL